MPARPPSRESPVVRRSIQPRVVVVTRPTEYEVLLERHGTKRQTAFFLESRGQSIATVRARDQSFTEKLEELLHSLPVEWRRSRVQRSDLDRFLFEPDDYVVCLGQDGLVANVAKYLSGQVVIGCNPDPERYDGVLVPHPPHAAADLVRTVMAGHGRFQERIMALARCDDGRELLALNEIFIGHRTHQSARYRIECGEVAEQHSSSGLIVATGTGATGWARSIALERHTALQLPSPTERRLVFFVREAWPSISTETGLTEGALRDDCLLQVTSRMEAGGTLFGDGIESDRLEFGWGQKVTLAPAPRTLHWLQP